MKIRPSGTTEKFASIRELSGHPQRVFAIGDIHGYSEELAALLDFLVDVKGCGNNDQVIFIGDYIDRGPGSKSVLERVLSVQSEWPHTVFLKGNHEEMLLSFLGLGGHNGEFYIRNGGAAFFQSYGIEGLGSLTAIREQIPDAHLKFLQNLELGVQSADFVFVHAGLRPTRPLDQQNGDDLLWIREDFIQHPHQFGKTVVFGHTAFNQIFLDLPYRVGIDTGAGYGNKLSAIELIHREVYQVNVGERSVRQSRLDELLPSRS